MRRAGGVAQTQFDSGFDNVRIELPSGPPKTVRANMSGNGNATEGRRAIKIYGNLLCYKMFEAIRCRGVEAECGSDRSFPPRPVHARVEV